MELQVKKIYATAQLPVKAYEDDAGYDLYAYVRWDYGIYADGKNTFLEITPYEVFCVHTGIAVSIPKGYVGLVLPRSSITKRGIKIAQGTGVIDSGYQGQVNVEVVLDQATAEECAFDEGYPIIKHGERIAQLVIVPLLDCTIKEVKKFDVISKRGQGGFGSTGK